MTGQQRLLCTLDHREPDMVPISECLYSRPLFEEVLGHAPEIFDAETVFRCCAEIGYDYAFIPFTGVAGFRPDKLEKTPENIYKDEWGISYKWDPNAWPIDGAIATPLKDRNDWKNYTMPNALEDWRYDGIRDVAKLRKENGLGIIGNVRGPYSAAWMLFGMENFSLMFYRDPETLDEALSAMTDFACDAFVKMAECGVDALLFSDDYGSTAQPLFSPKHFKKHMKPQIEKLVRAAERVGLPLIMHSDGHVKPFLADCVEVGVRGWHPIERAAGMDLGEAKRDYGDKLCLFGNVDNKDELVHGTPESIAAQVKECIQTAAPGGGYCLSSDHSVHEDIPNRNVFALYEAGRRYGAYPIRQEA